MFRFQDMVFAMIGVPIPHPSATPPAGTVMMVGQAIDPITQPILRQRYGAKLPDMRGEFIRGWDNNRRIDTDRALLSWQRPTIVPGYDDNGTPGRPANYDLVVASGRMNRFDAFGSDRLEEWQQYSPHAVDFPEGFFAYTSAGRRSDGGPINLLINALTDPSCPRDPDHRWHCTVPSGRRGMDQLWQWFAATKPRNVAFNYICISG